MDNLGPPPPKCKFFAWLVINNRIWTADRLQKRGWPNCNMCPLCKQVQESAAHLLFKCRYTVRVWNMIKAWLGLHDIYPQNWAMVDTVKNWWSANASNRTQSRRPLTCLMLLVSWEIWKERNARVFRNVAVPVGVLVARIKDEMALWCLAGAKHLCNINATRVIRCIWPLAKTPNTPSYSMKMANLLPCFKKNGYTFIHARYSNRARSCMEVSTCLDIGLH